MGNQTFIEINGKKYDAVTGKMLGDVDKPSKVSKAVVQPTSSVGVVDGFVRRTRSSNSTQRPQHHAVKKAQKAQTLARAGVKKPLPSQPQTQSKVVKPTLKTPAQRTFRSQTVQKSNNIQRYQPNEKPRSSVSKRSAELSVSQQELHTATNGGHIKSAANSKLATRPSNQLIESALHNANSHEATNETAKRNNKPSLTKKLGVSRRTASISSVVLAVVLLAGFFAVQNVPNLSMRVASTRAGFGAQMPGYKPAGFAFSGPINYQPGRVTITYKSNADSRQYSLTQTNSNWNSDALLTNFISSEKKQYQTYLDKGRTLYIYDNSNVTWVDNGVWYQIEGDADLTTDQLIRIASSL